jgi:hypothetical protein
MKQLENNMKIHKIYLETLAGCSIIYTVNINAILNCSHVRYDCVSSTLAAPC